MGLVNTRFTFRMKRGMCMAQNHLCRRAPRSEWPRSKRLDPSDRKMARPLGMKPSLVTVANGHLGNNLCRQLSARAERLQAMIPATADPAPPAGLALEAVRVSVVDA